MHNNDRVTEYFTEDGPCCMTYFGVYEFMFCENYFVGDVPRAGISETNDKSQSKLSNLKKQ